MFWLIAAVLVAVGWLWKNQSWARVWRFFSVALVALLLVRGADGGRLRRHVQVVAEQESVWTLEFRDGANAMRDLLSQSNWSSAPLLLCLMLWSVTGGPGRSKKEKANRSERSTL